MTLRHNILAFILLASMQLFAQQAKVSVKTDTNAILIGEQVLLDLKYELPVGKTPLFPAFNDTLTAQIEIVKRSAVDTVIDPKTQTLSLQQQLTITSFDTGYFVIPSIPFGMMAPGDSTFTTIASDPLLLNVFTVEVDTTKDIKPIVRPLAQPYTLAEFLPHIIVALLVIAFIILAVYLYRRYKKKKPLFKKKEKPALPPYQEAIQHLELLKMKKLWQNGQVKEYQSELTDIIRHYIERRFGINAVEMVSFEIMEALKEAEVNQEVLAKINATFELADLVKFAKSGASAIENDTSFNNCIDFVNETKRVVVTEEKTQEQANVAPQNEAIEVAASPEVETSSEKEEVTNA